MMYVDQMGYLPDDILVKVDRAGMRVSLESRIPLLDHRVVEFAWRMPTGLRVRHGATKWPLRQILARYVPQELFMRPKQGFSVPVGVWLRGPLREWAEDLLSDAALRGSGFFDVPAVRATWSRHLRGVEDAHVELWSVLMAQAWIRSRA